MTIHKGNIEAYLLDYIEGNLDALLTADLMAFLSENPEYEKWIPEYDGHLCLKAGPVFEDKPMLKKSLQDVPLVDENNFDEFCVASSEGWLESEGQARLEEYIGMHPERRVDLDLYGKIILQPDYLLFYPDKRRLKKQQPAVIPMRFIYYAIGIAASIAVLFLLVSRKPAEETFSVKNPARSSGIPVQKIEPVPETSSTAAPAETKTAVPVSEEVRKFPDIQKEAVTADVVTPSVEPLAAIEPIRTGQVSPSAVVPEIHVVIPPSARVLTFPEPEETAYATEQTPLRILGSVAKKLNLWKAAEKAVTGFNYLTESRLSLVRTTDENGKFSSLSLESEEYVDSGNKVK
jgi:hypothetical protein